MLRGGDYDVENHAFFIEFVEEREGGVVDIPDYGDYLVECEGGGVFLRADEAVCFPAFAGEGAGYCAAYVAVCASY